MSKLREIIGKYTAGEATLEATNRALEDAGAGFHLNPGNNGYGLLGTGTGSLDKVQVKNGQLVNCDCGNMYALLSIAGKTYHVRGRALAK